MSKKQEILKLRDEGKTYREIEVLLDCSRSLISYYCNPTQAKKAMSVASVIRIEKMAW